MQEENAQNSQNVEKILARFRESFNLSNNSRLAELIGVKPNVVSAWIARNSIGDYDTLFTFCRKKGVNIDWLLTGEGEMFRNKEEKKEERETKEKEQEEVTSQGKEPSAPVPSASTASTQLERRIAALERKLNTITLSPPDPNNAVEIPFFLEGVSAGTPTTFQSDLTEHLTLDKSLLKRPSKCFAVRAIGDSMVGTGIENGDILIVERDRPLSNGKIVIARLHNNETTVKKLKINKTGITSLIPANKKHKVIKLTPESNVVIIGTVIYIIREM